MSSGVEKRPSGMVERNFARISGVSSPMTIDPDGGAEVAAFAFAKADQGWRVTFDGLIAVVEPVREAAAT